MSATRRTLLFVFLGTVMVPFGCGVRESVLATVGPYDVEIATFQTYLEAVTGEKWQNVDERVASRLMDQFLDQEVVVAAARQLLEPQIPVEPGRRSAAVRRLLEQLCGPVPQLPEAAIIREVERRLQVSRPARAHVRQMLLQTREEAAEVRRRLLAGQDFVTVSRDVSLAPNADGGGEVGMLEQGTLPPEMDEVIFALGEDEISEPVEGPAGYHLFQVVEVAPEGPPRRERVRVEVVQELSEEHARAFMQECVDRLARDVQVTIYQKHLWFRYDGKYQEGEHESG